jgi:hypothetical protein
MRHANECAVLVEGDGSFDRNYLSALVEHVCSAFKSCTGRAGCACGSVAREINDVASPRSLSSRPSRCRRPAVSAIIQSALGLCVARRPGRNVPITPAVSELNGGFGNDRDRPEPAMGLGFFVDGDVPDEGSNVGSGSERGVPDCVWTGRRVGSSVARRRCRPRGARSTRRPQ